LRVSHATSGWRSGSRETAPDPRFSFARGPSAAEQSESDFVGWVSIRNQALARLRKMTHGHIRIACEPPRGRVPGPHALAYLYAYHAASSTMQIPVYHVGAATRVVDDSDDTRPGHNVRDLRSFLDGMVDVALDGIREGGFDPRTSMADRADEMPASAAFVGIGVSSLGQPGDDWPRARAAALAGDGLAELNMPALWRIRLVDATRIEVTRPAGLVRENVRSSEPLDPPRHGVFTVGGYLTGWSRLPDVYTPGPDEPDYWLDHLCRVVDDGIRAGGQGRRRR
jgi:hypothetical protein